MDVWKILQGRQGFRYGLLFPARFWITHNGEEKEFRVVANAVGYVKKTIIPANHKLTNILASSVDILTFVIQLLFQSLSFSLFVCLFVFIVFLSLSLPLLTYTSHSHHKSCQHASFPCLMVMPNLFSMNYWITLIFSGHVQSLVVSGRTC